MSSAHKYGAGTRLSSAYTMGRNGKPYAKHFGPRSGAAFKAWKEGLAERHERHELAWLKNLALAGMSSLFRVGKLSKRDARRLAELEEKYGR